MSREQSNAEAASGAASVTVLRAGSDEADSAAGDDGVVECLGMPAPAAELTVALWSGAHTVIVDDVKTAQRVVDLVVDVQHLSGSQ